MSNTELAIGSWGLWIITKPSLKLSTEIPHSERGGANWIFAPAVLLIWPKKGEFVLSVAIVIVEVNFASIIKRRG